RWRRAATSTTPLSNSSRPSGSIPRSTRRGTTWRRPNGLALARPQDLREVVRDAVRIREPHGFQALAEHAEWLRDLHAGGFGACIDRIDVVDDVLNACGIGIRRRAWMRGP